MDNQAAAILKQFEEEVDRMMETGTNSTASSGAIERHPRLGEEGSPSPSPATTRSSGPPRQSFLEEDNQLLRMDLARCQDEIHKLQQENAGQLRQTELLQTRMMDYLKTSLDSLKASENAEKEQLRGELQSAQGKIRELEAARDVAQREAELKTDELQGKDKMIQDLSSTVKSLEQAVEEKSWEVADVKEELAREKEAGGRKWLEMEERVRNKLKDVFFAAADELGNQLTMEVGEAENPPPVIATQNPAPETIISSGGGRRNQGTRRKPIRFVGGTRTESGTSSSIPSGAYNLRRRMASCNYSEQDDCDSTLGSNSNRSNRKGRRKTTTPNLNPIANRKDHAVDPNNSCRCICGKRLRSNFGIRRHVRWHLVYSANPKPCLLCGTKRLRDFGAHLRTQTHLRNLYKYQRSGRRARRMTNLPQENENRNQELQHGIPAPGSQEDDEVIVLEVMPSTSSRRPAFVSLLQHEAGTSIATQLCPGGTPNELDLEQDLGGTHDVTLGPDDINEVQGHPSTVIFDVAELLACDEDVTNC